MEPEYITYQKFNDPALANGLTELLEQHGVNYRLEEVSSGFDASIVMTNAAIEYLVKLKSDDFEFVNNILKEEETKNIAGIDKDYYLFSFTDDELMDVLIKADEWSVLDKVLSRKLLAERGNIVSDEAISAIKAQRIEDLRKPEASQMFWIAVGYLFAFCGGILGFFIGWHLSTYKKTLPDGKRVYGYTESDRKHGKIIFYISFIGLATAFIYEWTAVFK